jgi:hypothetical protein
MQLGVSRLGRRCFGLGVLRWGRSGAAVDAVQEQPDETDVTLASLVYDDGCNRFTQFAAGPGV